MESICNCSAVEIKVITTEIPIANQKVILENVEVKVCLDCGEIQFDGRMILALESKILNSRTDKD